MPDPTAPGISYFYCDDIAAMEKLTLLLVRKNEWFDVRRMTIHKWSICFSAIMQIPKDVSKKLIAVEPQETEIERNVAAYKAKKAAELRGTKGRR